MNEQWHLNICHNKKQKEDLIKEPLEVNDFTNKLKIITTSYLHMIIIFYENWTYFYFSSDFIFILLIYSNSIWKTYVPILFFFSVSSSNSKTYGMLFEFPITHIVKQNLCCRFNILSLILIVVVCDSIVMLFVQNWVKKKKQMHTYEVITRSSD